MLAKNLTMHRFNLIGVFAHFAQSNNKQKSNGILKVARWSYIFLQFFSSDYFLYSSVAHFKLGTGLATLKCYKNPCLVPPLGNLQYILVS